MNICIYGSASDDIDKKYITATEELGKKLAEHSHSLIFGAGACGLMGAAARGFTMGNGKITGIVPTFFNVDGLLYDKCTELIRTETMSERKNLMADKADAFIMTPGGIGTFDEFFEMLTLKQLSRHDKAMVIYNIDGYYNDMIKMIEHSIGENFIKEKCKLLYKVCDNSDDITDYLENYKPLGLDILHFKNV